MNTHDGGAAFPGEKDMRFGKPNDCNEGMNLRDYFAAKAMQSFLACDQGREMHQGLVAVSAYAVADAMLAARQAPSAEPRG